MLEMGRPTYKMLQWGQYISESAYAVALEPLKREDPALVGPIPLAIMHHAVSCNKLGDGELA